MNKWHPGDRGSQFSHKKWGVNGLILLESPILGRVIYLAQKADGIGVTAIAQIHTQGTVNGTVKALDISIWIFL